MKKEPVKSTGLPNGHRLGTQKTADWYSIITVCVVLRGRREIISHRDCIGGGFIWRHLSALLLLRNQSFVSCACMSASNICFVPVLLFAVPSLGSHRRWNRVFFIFAFSLFPACIHFKFWWEGKLFHPWSLHKPAEVLDEVEKLTMCMKTLSRQIHLPSDASVYFYPLTLTVSWKCSVPGCVPVMHASDPDWRGQIGLEGFLTWTVLRLKTFEVASCLHQKPCWRPQFVLVSNHQTTIPLKRKHVGTNVCQWTLTLALLFNLPPLENGAGKAKIWSILGHQESPCDPRS